MGGRSIVVRILPPGEKFDDRERVFQKMRVWESFWRSLAD